MGNVKIPYYAVKKGRGYWQPTPEMRKSGAKQLACGDDGPGAWARAQRALDAWRALNREEAKFKPAPREGTLAKAFSDYRATDEWASKAVRTREEWERCWRYIEPAFGSLKPSVVTLADLSGFRKLIEARVSLREAHRCVKVWRALWRVAAALKYCQKDADPSQGMRNVEPERRQAVWNFLDAVKLAKTAWRLGYRGLAAVIAVAWDTSFSPVDVRRLTPEHRQGDVFVGRRSKTGREAVGTLTRRSQRVLEAYLGSLGCTIAPNAPIFRNRSKDAYSKDTLGDDFRVVRAAAFGETEGRTLADFRRSGAVEAMRGDATDLQIGAKLANQFAKSSFLKGTYAPVDLASVRAADEARRRGRK